MMSQQESLQNQLIFQNKVAEQSPDTQIKPFYSVSANGDSRKTITILGIRQVPMDDFFQSYGFEGTTMQITVEIRPADGNILVDTSPPTLVDFQSSVRAAVQVAENIVVDLSNYDVIFAIESDQDMKAGDGQSAGVALMILLISELIKKEVQRDVLMTGSINPIGIIGRVGGITEKTDAAGKYGVKIFLIPLGQSTAQIQSCEE